MRLRVLISILALGLSTGAVSQTAAQPYPSKVIHVVVGYAAGGVLDGLMRAIAAPLAQSMGQPVVVDNRPGANTSLGTGVCAKAAPDGYTICTAENSLNLNALLYRNLPYKPERDLAPITNMVFIHSVIVANSGMPFDDLRSTIAYAKAHPGKLNFGSFGEGSTGHLYLEWIKKNSGADITHVAYKGAAPVITATLANEVQLMYMNIGAVLPHIKAGKLKPIAIPAPKRSLFLPDVPTLSEQGYDFKPSSWFGLFTAAGTPSPILARLHTDVRNVLFNDKFREQILNAQFYEPVGNSPEEFAEFLKGQRQLAAQLVNIVGLKPFD